MNGDDDDLLCMKCGENLGSLTFAIKHRTCNHYSHTDCLSDAPNYKLCSVCLGEREMPIAKEPTPNDGIDYVLHPGTKPSSIKRGISSLVTRNGNSSSLTPCMDLLIKKVPLNIIKTKHKLGLQHMLKEGITIDDLLDNGYTWDTGIKDFEDIRTRLNDALWALNLDANHLRDCGTKELPIQKLKDAGLSVKIMRDDLNLHFPPDGPLQCNGDIDWDICDCQQLGLCANDFTDLGLTLLQQYEDLVMDVPPREAAAAEKAIGITKQFLLNLKDIEEYVEEEEEEEKKENSPMLSKIHERSQRKKVANVTFTQHSKRTFRRPMQEALHKRHGFKM